MIIFPIILTADPLKLRENFAITYFQLYIIITKKVGKLHYKATSLGLGNHTNSGCLSVLSKAYAEPFVTRAPPTTIL